MKELVMVLLFLLISDNGPKFLKNGLRYPKFQPK